MGFSMTKLTSNRSTTDLASIEYQLHFQVDYLIAQWKTGRYKSLEDIWLNMQELQFRIGSKDDALRMKLNGIMRQVADALWRKYNQQD